MSNEEARKQCPWELWVLFFFGTIVIAVTAGIGLIRIVGWPRCLWELLFGGYIDPQQSNYLLSATAQVLGALFALVFSITFIAVQFTVKYTHRAIKIIFHPLLIFYIIGFASGVVLPLWWLLYPTEVGTYISLITGSAVVGSLVLLFLDLRKRMSVEWATEIFRRKAIRALPDDLNQIQENIETLDIISTGAFKSGDTGAFEKAVEARIEILSKICKPSNQEEPPLRELHKETFETIRDTALTTIDDPRAPRIIIDKFKTVGISAIKEWVKEWLESSKKPMDATDKDVPQTALYAINIIMIIAEACDREVQDRILFTCAIALAEMAEHVNNFERIMKYFEGRIRCVCKCFKNFEKWYPRVIKHIKKHIHKINTQHLRVLPPLRPAQRSKKHSG